VLQLRREAGPVEPTTYRLSWTGNDGTFSSPSSIVLPLRETTPLTVSIAPRTAAAHSAILNVHDPASGSVVARSLATVIVAERLDAGSHVAGFEGRVALMRAAHHFWNVPAKTSALSVDLTVSRGAMRAILTPPGTRSPSQYPDSHYRMLPPGTYHFTVPDPAPGIWSVTLTNDSPFNETKRSSMSTSEAQYTVTASALAASLTVTDTDGRAMLAASNHGARIEEPSVKQSWGTLTSRHARFKPDGTLEPFEIQVPQGASVLIVTAGTIDELGPATASAPGVDLYVYDCTTGECFAHDFAFPATHKQRVVVRRPYAGRWVAMVGGPSFPSAGSYAIDAVVATELGSQTVSLGRSLDSDEHWTGRVATERSRPTTESVRVYELFDKAIERREAQEPWVSKDDFQKLTNRPVALAIAIDSALPSSEGTLGTPGERPR
jgi:hypothetical protein